MTDPINPDILKALGAKFEWIDVTYPVSAWGNGRKQGAEPGVRVHVPEGADPDQIYDATYEWLKTAVNRTAGPTMKEIIESAPVATTSAPATQQQQAGGQHTEKIGRYELLEQVDDKFQLVIYPVLSNGNLGQYPLTKYTVKRDVMQSMLAAVGSDALADDGELFAPADKQVMWTCVYEDGREKQQGKGRYKDLLSLAPAV